jgi:hypothetical protein
MSGEIIASEVVGTIGGKLYVNLGGVIKSVRPEEVPDFLIKGYELGTGLLDTKCPSLGKIWVRNDQGVHDFIHPHELHTYISKGFYLTTSPTEGTIWVHKGAEELMIPRGAEEAYLLEGYSRGRGINPSEGRFWIHKTTDKGTDRKRVKAEYLDAYISLGYTKGNGLSGELNPFSRKLAREQGKK